MNKKSFTIFSQSGEEGNFPDQLTLPLVASQKPAQQANLFSRKPQISSVPEISPRERNRYRVLLGDRILGDRLTIDEALKLAKGGGC
jgi:hypothetical protein